MNGVSNEFKTQIFRLLDGLKKKRTQHECEREYVNMGEIFPFVLF